MTLSSYDWVREIKPELKALDETPLTGAAPSFPWDELAAKIGKAFEKENIKLEPGEVGWRTKDTLFEGLGDSPFPLHLAIPSLKGDACWIMPEQEMASLESFLLTKDPHPITFQDRSLSESFYRFLALETLYQMSQISFEKSLVPLLTSQTELPNQDSFCLDIKITIDNQVLWGRLIISPELKHSWIDYFSKRGPSQLTKEIAQKVELVVHLEVGQAQLSLQDWSHVSPGDFISLDKCLLDPHSLNGRVRLTVNRKAILIGQLEESKVTIVEYPEFQEVETPMAKENNEDDDLSDLGDSLDDQEESLFGDDDDLLGLDDDLTKEQETETLAASPQEAKSSSHATAPTSSPIKLEEIPISLIVEIGRIQLSVQKLTELEPGNILDLNVQPKDGVDLVINGKTVGKGELLRIGETLGVRVLELGR